MHTCVHAHVCIASYLALEPKQTKTLETWPNERLDLLNRRSVSIEDIARAAGVSHSTVSRALRDSSMISSSVRERIQQLARDMGYTPNIIAQSLQNQQTNTVGLVVTSIADPFYVDILSGVEEVAQPAGISVFLSISHNEPEQEMIAIETFHRRRVDGILVASSRISGEYATRLQAINVPTILINNHAEEQYDALQSVTVDDREGAQIATEHLLGLGHRTIGYLGAHNRPKSNQRRFEGYSDALRAAGIVISPERIVTAFTAGMELQDDVMVTQALFGRLLQSDVTAVFCYNDMMAIGGLLACREQGIEVPRDLSIIGFDDIDLTRYVWPPLTTIHQPKRRMGQRAMQMLLDVQAGKSVQNQILSTSLVERASTSVPCGIA